ncbi:hypothetical protein [Enterococcus sp. 2201sp1_2201st1_B8_2201SCRN_220225]|uniref:hypothetical protein n=1 Tax=unclassified Enterococcus TaxID=2608891 RepID=UPI0034A4F549
MKTYMLVYWKGVNDEEGCFVEEKCLISDETLASLLSNETPNFIKVIVDDGEAMFFPTTNINYIKEVYEAAPERF